MKKIKIQTIMNIEKIRGGMFINVIPELYELKNVIEKNEWHSGSVFSHVLTVLKKLEEILDNVKNKISEHLNQKIENYTKKELLFLAALFHDIAKKETLIKKNDKTFCPNHEGMGAIKAKKILSRFYLSSKERYIVIQLIKSHGILHSTIKPKNNELEKEFTDFKKKYSDLYLELVLLAMADTLGSHLRYNKPESFNFRIKFYKKFLDIY